MRDPLTNMTGQQRESYLAWLSKLIACTTPELAPANKAPHHAASRICSPPMILLRNAPHLSSASRFSGK